MQYSILLDRTEDLAQVEAEEQLRFIKLILEALEISTEVNLDEPLSVDDKIKFRAELEKFNIYIISMGDGSLEVFVDNNMIGVWKKPTYKLKQDLSQINPKKRIYLEMTNRFSTVFEDSE